MAKSLFLLLQGSRISACISIGFGFLSVSKQPLHILAPSIQMQIVVVRIEKQVLLTPKALRGMFWAFGVFDHGPLVSILLQIL